MASEIIQGFGVNRGDKDDPLDRVLIGLDELDTVIPDDASGEAIIILRDAIRTLVDEVRDIPRWSRLVVRLSNREQTRPLPHLRSPVRCRSTRTSRTSAPWNSDPVGLELAHPAPRPVQRRRLRPSVAARGGCGGTGAARSSTARSARLTAAGTVPRPSRCRRLPALCVRCAELVVACGFASRGLLQRQLGVTLREADEILTALEHDGVLIREGDTGVSHVTHQA